MLALAATNIVSVVLFGVLYATAGARLMSQAAFLLCLVVIFGLVTVLWVRVEARHRALEPLSRVGRVAAALVGVLVGVPVIVLMPAFWLDSALPPEAAFTPHLAPLMTLTLISLVLVLLVNVAGAAVAVARGVMRSRLRAATR
jgi:hypothetical protein